MPKCKYCGEEKPARGFSIHEKNCKKRLKTPQEKKEEPDKEIQKTPPEEPDIKNPQEEEEKIEKQLQDEGIKNQEEEEEKPNTNLNIIAFLAVLAIIIMGILYFFKSPITKEEEKI